MNIIFGRENALLLEDKQTLLELDTIRFPNGHEVAVFCAIDSLSMFDLPKVDSMKNLHANLIENYRNRDWNYCLQALEHLRGFWNNELDTFYTNLEERIEINKDQEVVDDWWIIKKDLVG